MVRGVGFEPTYPFGTGYPIFFFTVNLESRASSLCFGVRVDLALLPPLFAFFI